MSSTPSSPDRSSGAASSAEDGPGDSAALGLRVRHLRKAARMTLEAASVATGISRAAISKIERGEMSPTYDSLRKLSRGLRVDLAALVSGRSQTGGGVAVTRANQGAEQRTERFVHHLLAPEFEERAMYVFETEVRAGSLEDYDQWDRHDSEDFLYVLTGAVTVHLAERDPVELRQGDGLQMDGRIPHALVASTGRKGARKDTQYIARLLWVSVPFER